MVSTSEKTLKLPSFDGKPESFQVWWIQFVAFATVHKFIQVVKETQEADLPASHDEVVGTDVAGKKKEAARWCNNMAMANFTMAFTTEGCMGMIYKAIMPQWPSGLAYMVVKALNQKYKPTDMISRVEMWLKLNKVSMQKSEDPVRMFEQISAIQNMYNMMTRSIEEEGLVTVVLEKAPQE